MGHPPGLGWRIKSLRRLDALCQEKKHAGLEEIRNLPTPLDAVDLKTAVLQLAKVFPASLLISAVAADIPEEISRLALDVMGAISLCDEALSETLKLWLRANLGLVLERGAFLVAEALLALAIKQMPLKQDGKSLDFGLVVDLKDFAYFMDTLARQLTSSVTPGDARPQKAKSSAIDLPSSADVEALCSSMAPNIDVIPMLIRQVDQAKRTPRQAAEALYAYVEEHSNGSGFLREEYQGRLREIEEEGSFTGGERLAAKQVSWFLTNSFYNTHPLQSRGIMADAALTASRSTCV